MRDEAVSQNGPILYNHQKQENQKLKKKKEIK